jgi:ferrochelatase
VRSGVLLLAHGSAASLDEVPAFVQAVRRGRPAPPAVIAEVRRRYEAIGGRSPLLDVTRETARRLSERLGLPCLVGMRLWSPTIEDALREAASLGLERLVVITTAPHSAPTYEVSTREAAERLSAFGVAVPALTFAPALGDAPELIEVLAAAVRAALAQLPAADLGRAVLVPCAHSVPMHVVRAGEPYPEAVERTARALLERLGADALPHILAFQSQGMTEGQWLGPDLATAFARAAQAGARVVVLAPIGFVSDHVETLYDLDIEARAVAEKMGLRFVRVPCPNESEALVGALAAVVRWVLGADR